MNLHETTDREQGHSTDPGFHPRSNPGWTVVEVILGFAVIFLICGERAPDINESHYLTKAKHFWNPAWCPNDFFLQSADAHFIYFLSLGWVTKFFSLSTSAWLLRGLNWLLFAWAWQRFSARLIPGKFNSVLTLLGFLFAIKHLHLAGEWIVGGAEAKGIAYVFVVFALERLLASRWNSVWILLGIASMFHVLVGGWCLLAALVVCLLSPDRPDWKKLVMGVAIAGILASVGLIPAMLLTVNQTEGSVSLANEIYVRVRLPHHLYFWSFQKTRIVAFFLGLVAWAFFFQLQRTVVSNRIHQFCAASFLVGLLGIGLSSLSNFEPTAYFANACLRFYLFRISDFALAIGLVVGFTSFLQSKPESIRRIGIATFLVLCLVLTGWSLQQRRVDSRPSADAASLPTYEDDSKRTQERYKNWVKLCEWIERNTPADAVFLTPFEQQTFNWYAQRSQVFCRKDIPQDARGIFQWQARLSALYQSDKNYQWQDRESIVKLSKQFGFRYLIVDQAIANQREFDGFAISFEMVYPENRQQRVSYVVYKIR